MEKEKLYEIHTEDLPKYFRHTFVRIGPLEEPEKAKWDHIEEITRMSDNPKSILIQTNRNENGTMIKDLFMDLEFPEIGNYNLNNTSYRYQRRPRRQYRKSVSGDNSSFINPTFYLNGRYSPPPALQFDWHCISMDKLFTEGKPVGIGAIRDYYNSIFNKKSLISRAVDKEISIGIGTLSKQPDIYFNCHRVGAMLSPNCISLYSSEFEEEFKDRCIPHQLEVIVNEP